MAGDRRAPMTVGKVVALARALLDQAGAIVASTVSAATLTVSSAVTRTASWTLSGTTAALYIQDTANGASTNVHQYTIASAALTSGASYSFSNVLPAGAVILGVSARITTTITGCTSVTIGDGADADRYGTLSTLTSGWTIANAATASPLEWRSAAGSVVLTAVGGGGAFTAGVVRITVHYLSNTAPTS